MVSVSVVEWVVFAESVPVTVTVYAPAGVQPEQPPPPPPPPPLLLLPQAGIRKSAAITIPIMRNPNSLFRPHRAELKHIPMSDIPAIGSHSAWARSTPGYTFL
jgi:hypothetical protein